VTPQFVTDRHLGGYIRSTPDYPHGDPWTWCPEVWDWIIKVFAPRTLIDLGCGEGHALKYFLDRGVTATGIEGMVAARDAGIVEPTRFVIHDFTQDVLDGIVDFGVDVVWSCEFVEHVEERYMERFLRVFDLAGKAVLMTHAFPGQGGYHHVNCQPAEYWIERMVARGFRFDQAISEDTRRRSPGTHWARSGLVLLR
jgi:cyclopropane fatty-acyl-phospholipid synthase-like methyltransferase